jgi:hypothetical protein
MPLPEVTRHVGESVLNTELVLLKHNSILANHNVSSLQKATETILADPLQISAKTLFYDNGGLFTPLNLLPFRWSMFI